MTKIKFICMTIFLIGISILSLYLGSTYIPMSEMVANSDVMLDIRLPRLLAAIFAGMALACSGILLQTFFKNSIAGPFVLGINSGAGLGVAMITLTTGIAFQGTVLFDYGLVTAALGGSLIVMLIVLLISSKMQLSSDLLVIGIFISYAVSSLVQVLMYFASPDEIEGYVSWGFGTFGSMTLNEIYIFLPLITVGVVCSVLLSKKLNIFMMGEIFAISVGVNVKLLRFSIIILSSCLAAFVTAFCGPIAFIGIAAPHFARRLFKSEDRRIVMPAAAICGALLAVGADIIARVPFTDFSLPLNAVISIIGAPIVISAMLSHRK